MTATTDPSRRTAEAPGQTHSGPVTLINSFIVPPGREAAFLRLWSQTSAFFRAQPGFVGLRMHRALSPNAAYRFVNVAEWSSAPAFAEAHAQERFRELVSRPEWSEFPSSPALYEVTARYAVASSDPPSIRIGEGPGSLDALRDAEALKARSP